MKWFTLLLFAQYAMWSTLGQPPGTEEEDPPEAAVSAKRTCERNENQLDTLREIMLRNKESLKKKEEEVQEYARKLSKIKSRAKLSRRNKDATASSSETMSKSNIEVSSLEPADVVDDVSQAKTPKAKSSLLQRKLAENRKIFEKRSKEMTESKRAVEEKVEAIRQQLEERDLSLVELQKDWVPGTPVKPVTITSEIVTPMMQLNQVQDKDNKIAELSNKILELEATIIDLRENLKEKDSVIDSKTKAVTLMSADLSMKGKTTLDKLEDTKDEMRSMQEHFVLLETSLKSKNDNLLEQLLERDNRISELEETIKRFEQQLQEQKLAETASADFSRSTMDTLADTKEAMKSMQENFVLIETSLKSKIENLLQQLQDRETRLTEAAERISKLETGTKTTKEPVVTELHHRLDEAERSIEQLQNEKHELQKIIDESQRKVLSTEPVHTNDLIIEKDNRIAELENLIEELKKSNQLLEEESTSELKNQVAELSTRNEDYSNRINELEKQVHILEIEKNDLAMKVPSEGEALGESEKVMQLTKELDDLNKSMIKLKAQHKVKLKNLQKQLESFKMLSDTNAELVTLGNQVALLEEEKGNLQLSLVDFDELKASAADWQDRIADLESKVSTQTKEIQDHIDAIATLENQKLDLIQELHSVKQELSTLEAENAESENLRVIAEMKVVELEEQIESLMRSASTNKQTESNAEELSKKVEALARENQELLDKLAKLEEKGTSDAGSTESFETLQDADKNELLRRLEELAQRNNDLVAKLSNLEEKPGSNCGSTESFETIHDADKTELLKRVEVLSRENNDLLAKLTKSEEKGSSDSGSTESFERIPEQDGNSMVEMLTKESTELVSKLLALELRLATGSGREGSEERSEVEGTPGDLEEPGEKGSESIEDGNEPQGREPESSGESNVEAKVRFLKERNEELKNRLLSLQELPNVGTADGLRIEPRGPEERTEFLTKVKELEDTNEKLQEELNAMIREKEELSAKVDRLQRDLTKLEKESLQQGQPGETKETSSQASEDPAKNSEMESSIKIASLEDELTECRRVISERNAIIEEIKLKLLEQEEELRIKRSLISDQQEAEKTEEDSRNELEDHLNVIEEWKSKCAQMEERISVLEAGNRSMEEELKTLREGRERLESLETLKKDLEDTLANLGVKEDQVSSLKAEVQKRDEELAEALSRLQNETVKNDDLLFELDILKTELRQKEFIMTLAVDEIRSLKNPPPGEESSSRVHTLEDAALESNELIQQVVEIGATLKETRERLEEREKDTFDLRHRLDRLIEKIRELENRFVDKERETEETLKRTRLVEDRLRAALVGRSEAEDRVHQLEWGPKGEDEGGEDFRLELRGQMERLMLRVKEVETAFSQREAQLEEARSKSRKLEDELKEAKESKSTRVRELEDILENNERFTQDLRNELSDAYKMMEQLKEKHSEDVAMQGSRLEVLMEEVQAKSQELERANAELEERIPLSTKVELEARVRELEATVADLEEKLVEANEKSRAQRDKMIRIAANLKKKAADLQDLESRAKELEERYATEKEEKETLNSRIQDLERRADDLEGRYALEKQEKEALNLKIEEERRTFEASAMEEETLKGRLRETETALLERDNKLADLEEKLLQARNETTNALETVEALTNEVNGSKEKIALLMDQVTGMGEEIGELRSRLEARSAEVEVERSRKEALAVELESYRSSLVEREAKDQEALDEAKENARELSVRMDVMEKEYVEQLAQIQQLRTENGLLSSKETQIVEKLENVEKESEERRVLLDQLRLENAGLLERLEVSLNSSARLEDLEVQYQDKEKEAQELRISLLELKMDNERLLARQENDEKKAEEQEILIDQLRLEIVELSKRLQEASLNASAKVEDLEERCRAKEKEVEEHRLLLEELKLENSRLLEKLETSPKDSRLGTSSGEEMDAEEGLEVIQVRGSGPCEHCDRCQTAIQALEAKLQERDAEIENLDNELANSIGNFVHMRETLRFNDMMNNQPGSQGRVDESYNQLLYQHDMLTASNEEIKQKLNETVRENKELAEKINSLQSLNFILQDRIGSLEEELARQGVQDPTQDLGTPNPGPVDLEEAKHPEKSALDFEGLSVELNRVNALKEDLENEVSRLKTEVDSWQKRSFDLQSDLEERRTEVEDLKKKAKELSSKEGREGTATKKEPPLFDAAKVFGFSTEVDSSLEEDVSRLKDLLNRKQEENERLTRLLGAAKRRVSSQRQCLDCAVSTDAPENAWAMLKSHLDETDRLLDSASLEPGQETTRESDSPELAALVAAKDEVIRSLDAELAALQGEVRSVTSSRDDLKDLLEAKSALISKLENDRSECLAEIDCLKSEKSDLNRLLNRIHMILEEKIGEFLGTTLSPGRDASALENQVGRVVSELRQLLVEKEEHLVSQAALKSRIQQLENQVQETEDLGRVHELQERASKVLRERDILQLQVNELTRSLEDLRKQLEEVFRERNELKEKVKGLSRVLDDLERKPIDGRGDVAETRTIEVEERPTEVVEEVLAKSSGWDESAGAMDEEEPWGWNADEVKLMDDSQFVGGPLVPSTEVQLQTKIAELEDRVKDLEAEKAVLQEENGLAKVRSGRLVKKLKEYKIQVEDLQQQLKDLRSTGSGCDLDSAIREELELNLKRLEERLAESRTEITMLTVEKDSLVNRIDVLVAANEAFVEAKERQDMQVEVLEIRNKELAGKVETLQHRVQEMETLIRVEDSENGSKVSGDLGELGETCRRLQDEVDDLKTQMEALAAENDQLRHILEERRSRKVGGQEAEDLARENEDLKTGLRNLSRDYDLLKTKFEEFQLEAKGDPGEVPRFQELEEALKTEAENLREEVEALKSLVADLQHQLENAVREKSSLASMLEAEREGFREDSESFEARTSELADQLRVVLQEKAELTLKIERLELEAEEKISSLNSNLAETTEFSNLRVQEVADLRQAIGELSIGVDQKDQEILKLGALLSEREDQLARLQSPENLEAITERISKDLAEKHSFEIQEKDVRIQDLRRTLENADQELDNLKTAMGVLENFARDQGIQVEQRNAELIFKDQELTRYLEELEKTREKLAWYQQEAQVFKNELDLVNNLLDEARSSEEALRKKIKSLEEELGEALERSRNLVEEVERPHDQKSSEVLEVAPRAKRETGGLPLFKMGDDSGEVAELLELVEKLKTELIAKESEVEHLEYVLSENVYPRVIQELQDDINRLYNDKVRLQELLEDRECQLKMLSEERQRESSTPGEKEETPDRAFDQEIARLQDRLREKEDYLARITKEKEEIATSKSRLQEEKSLLLEDLRLRENDLENLQIQDEEVKRDLEERLRRKDEELELARTKLQEESIAKEAELARILAEKDDVLLRISKKKEEEIEALKIQLHEETGASKTRLELENDLLENLRLREKDLENLRIQAEESRLTLEETLRRKDEELEQVRFQLGQENSSREEELRSLKTSLRERDLRIEELLALSGEEANQLAELRGLVEVRENEVSRLREELEARSREQESLRRILRHQEASGEETDEAGGAVANPTGETSGELDLALHMLYQRDVRCEELTLELMQLLEERDTLQLRLSNAIRVNEELRRMVPPGSEKKEGDPTPEDEPRVETPSPSKSPSSGPIEIAKEAIDAPIGEDKAALAEKLSQLKNVGHTKDVRLRDDRELRHVQQMSLLARKEALSNLPPEAAARLVNANYTLSRDVQSQSSVLLNWLRGKSTPKIVHM
ncbi:golgin subfamily B member 1 isoform X2 [Orussus abietinus]|uniref:golgin subfamily B member 1 isoform X2 n=1 Tax=Orussus abietinus TaxID=222816 RepID=UPI000C715C84|nr:golgin subfamily B member 1 isoform X2 [Orussus abietinus]